jgi:hypothetical protein
VQRAEDGECIGQAASGPALMPGSIRIHHPELKHPSNVISNRQIPELEAPLSHCKQTSGTPSNRQEYELLREHRIATFGVRTGSIAATAQPRGSALVSAFFAIMRCTAILPRLLEAKAN